MRKSALILAMLAFVALFAAACNSSGTIVEPPDDFTRMTAQVLGSDGSPMANLAVRVEGNATGVTTDANGNFTLERAAFPNGVSAGNELSLGKDGVILGNREVVPVQTPDLTLKFGDNFGLTQPGDPNGPSGPPDPDADPGSLTGSIFDETNADPLDGVEITLYAMWGELMMTTSVGGTYEFASVMPGEWRILATKAGYYPETAVVSIAENEESVQHMSMVPKNVITPGDGVIVRGTLLDADTNAPVAGATISMFADTGYYGVPEPAVYADMMEINATPGSAGAPAPMEDMAWHGDGDDAEPKGGSMAAPWMYEPQYLETTTNAEGAFAFDEEVVGYSIWLDMWAEGYLTGSHYEYIENRTGFVDLALTLKPFVPTTISGTVVNENGAPVEGAYVEFIYAGEYDVLPFDMAMPGGIGMEQAAADSREIWDSFDSPPPPAAQNSAGGSGDWDDWGDEADMMLNSAPEAAQSGAGASGTGVDNPFMQRFRWENQQGDRGTSDAPYFEGFYATNTDENGEYSFEDVPTGGYYIFASAYQHLPYSDMVEVVEDPAENEFEFVCPNIPVGAVEGVITDENGAPVPDALVNATQPNVDPFSYTDATGHYRIDNVPAGTWTISAYKQGFLTRTLDTAITDGGTATVNLVIDHYNPPDPTTINYIGHVTNGATNGGVVGADMVFTPVNNEYGGWFQHVYSGDNGAYSAVLIPTEYNILIQKEGYEDLFMRIWVDSLNPSMDFWLWEIGNNGGPWGGGGIRPMFDTAVGMPEMGMDDF